MGTIDGLSAARMLTIEAASVVNGTVDFAGNLILETRGGNNIDAGLVRGPQGKSAFDVAQENGYVGSEASWVTFISRTNPNMFVNPLFRLNQRNAISGATVADGKYFLDRMKTVYGAAAITWASDGNGGRVLTIPSGRVVASIQERANFLAGQVYTLSWTGTSTGRIYTSGTTAPGLAQSPVSFTANGLANVIIEWGSGSLYKVKLEASPVATAFVCDTVGDELIRALRYYQRFQHGAVSNEKFAGGMTTSSTTARILLHAKTNMRTTPTFITSGDLRIHDGSIVSDTTAITATTPGDVLQLTVVGAAGLVSFRPCELLAGSSSSFIELDAEL